MTPFGARIAAIAVLVAGGSWCGRADAQITLGFESVASGLASPVGIYHAGDGSRRLFILQQAGQILIHDGAQVRPTPFLDIATLVSCCGERGLLGLAFHPDFASNGLFYVNYTNTAGDTVIARYRVSDDPNAADPGSAQILLTIVQPFANHNGGQLAFGPDRFLYIGMGDGGSGGDPDNRAQNLGDLLGKLLRLDVDGGVPYAIPASNPFRNTPGARPEIWAWGLRNPWRFSFDRLTGDLFIADVGQATREEVDFQPASSHGGENYGWRLMEGTLCFNPASGCNDGSLTLPIL
jgi:glucose/arabinose dehydrogenase